MKLSVIIPTRNRMLTLMDALESILVEQSLSPEKYEILVVDNGSTDNTAKAIYQKNRDCGRIRYLYASEPGLHVARHLGAQEAKGEILVYIDDDVILQPGWLEAIELAFTEPSVSLVGGKILPRWEDKVPDWVNLFKQETEFGWTLGYLSLLDFGEITREIPGQFVFGCNFSIRKSVLFECGGFNPDSMPQELLRFRGDGETALSLEVMKKGYKVVYEPKATLYHRVPSERLTIEYFCQRAFNQGISDSFSQIRRKEGLYIEDCNEKKLNYWERSHFLNLFMIWYKKIFNKKEAIKIDVAKAYLEGKLFHRNEVAKDPELLQYILKEKYY